MNVHVIKEFSTFVFHIILTKYFNLNFESCVLFNVEISTYFWEIEPTKYATKILS